MTKGEREERLKEVDLEDEDEVDYWRRRNLEEKADEGV